jgi:hypothetical protein
VISYSVEALPQTIVSGFQGLVDRDTAMSGPVLRRNWQGHGGALTSLIVTSSRAFTGTFVLEGTRHSFQGLLSSPGEDPEGSATMTRGKGIPSLTFQFAIHRVTGELTGRLSDGIAAPVPVRAVRLPWSQSNPLDASLTGSYTAVLELNTSLQGSGFESVYPQGNGYLTLEASGDGAVNWTARLADGTAVKGTSRAGTGGEIPVHSLLYGSNPVHAGSLQGWVRIQSAPQPSEATLDGTVDWFKKAQPARPPTRSYAAGFPRHDLTVIGGRYSPPAEGSAILNLDVPAADAANARIVFSSGGIADAALGQAAPGRVTQALRISPQHLVTTPPGAANPAQTSVVLDAAKGLFSGTFTLQDNNPADQTPPIAVISRNVPFAGVLVPRIGKGAGHFQLPQLPVVGPPSTTPSNSPILSGQVILEATDALLP